MTEAEATIDNVDREVLDWILENHPHPILVTAGEGHEEHERNDILYVNRAFEEMTGYSKEDVAGEKPEILQGERTHEHIEDYMSETLAADEHFIGETVNYRKDGEEYAVRLSIDPIEQDGETTHWVSIQQEMTEDPLTRGFLRE